MTTWSTTFNQGEMMKKLTLIMVFMFLTTGSYAQLHHAEMAASWNHVDETLVPETNNIPPQSDKDYTSYFGRLRLQNQRKFPMYEMGFHLSDTPDGRDLSDLRFAGIQRLPFAGMTVKAMYVETNPENDTPTRTGGAYLMGGVAGITYSAGFDHQDTELNRESLYSIRLKRTIGIITLLGGASHQPGDQQRFTLGGTFEFPGQIILGALYGSWENGDGYAVNLGRYNRFGDFGGLPSFSLNYLEVPETYKWLNFRIMWGDRGGHYSPPTFNNGLLSDFYGIDMALMLKELIPDNYRHFDSPLLFRRYDEYGTVAFRVNYVDLAFNLRRLDSNLSFNAPWEWGPLRSLRGILTYERFHHPAYGWQDNRYHMTLATTWLDKVYAGVTYSSDFSDYNRLMLELRTYTTF